MPMHPRIAKALTRPKTRPATRIIRDHGDVMTGTRAGKCHRGKARPAPN